MHDVIGCGDAVRQLWEYLDHGVSDDDQRVLEQHLSYCVQCCGELEFARALQGLLRSGGTEPPDDVRERLDRCIYSLGDTDDMNCAGTDDDQ
jgi:anti-sigma factor (TIGR02949 family)